MVFHICVKFHGNMSSGFNIMERTQKMFTHTPREREREREREKTKTIYPIALHTSNSEDITRVTVHVYCMSSYGLTFV